MILPLNAISRDARGKSTKRDLGKNATPSEEDQVGCGLLWTRSLSALLLTKVRE